jgi:hypothetical protein
MNINWKRVGGLALIAVLLFIVISRPHESAAKVRHAGDSFGTFLSAVLN